MVPSLKTRNLQPLRKVQHTLSLPRQWGRVKEKCNHAVHLGKKQEILVQPAEGTAAGGAAGSLRIIHVYTQAQENSLPKTEAEPRQQRNPLLPSARLASTQPHNCGRLCLEAQVQKENLKLRMKHKH